MMRKDKSDRVSTALLLFVMAVAGAGFNAFAQQAARAGNAQGASVSLPLQPAVSQSFVQQDRRGNYRSGRLTGTWRFSSARSDNLENSLDRATRDLSADERQRIQERLRRRLEAPETLAIDQRGRNITIASTRAPQSSFDADGRTRTETTARGRTTRVSASLSGDQLVIGSMGDRGNEYQVTFDPIDNGQGLRVTRRIYDERLTQPVTAVSFYDRTSDVAQLNLYSGGRDDRDFGRTRGSFIVPDNTQMTAVLDTDLDTRRARSGDRFTMTVRSPSRYNGAIIEGVVREVERSGRVTGRAEMALDFERIRLRDGGSYDFEGYIESLRTPDGEDVRVDNEGSVKEDDSQTERTVTRSGIGAAVGAIIGAIAGGGTGAAIGAAVGAGAGAGSVFIQGRDDLELRSGTELTIRSSAPRVREARR